MKKHRSTRRRPGAGLALGMLAVIGWLACSSVAWMLADRNADRVEASARLAALARAEVASEAIEQNLLRLLEGIRSLGELALARQELRQAGAISALDVVETQLRGVAENGRLGVLQIAVVANDGWLAWSSEPGWKTVWLGDREHFTVHREQPLGLFVSAPLVGRVSQQWSLQFTRPMIDKTGAQAGILVVSVDPIQLSRDLTALSFGSHSAALILRRDGTVLAHGRDASQQLGDVLPPGDPLMQALATGRAGGLIMPASAGEREKLTGFSNLAEAPLAVAVSLDTAEEIQGTAFVRPSLRATALAFSVLLLAALALTMLWLDRRRTLYDLEMARREREAAQQRLVQAQRMEALGRLAGGVAHDFNNVLQAILGGAKLLAKRPGDEAGVRRLSRMLLEASERGAAVTRRLLAFARRVELKAAPVPLEPMLQGLREVLTHTLGREVEIVLDMPPGLPPAFADGAQLETVLINLAINARDAMLPMPERRLTFRLRLAAEHPPQEPGRQATPPPGLPGGSGGYLTVEVTDTGTGMDAVTLAQAMEPFFTTKAKGKGTGLGLAMAKGFAEQSGGALALHSRPGEGTVVTLWLPVAPEGAQAEPAAVPSPVPVGSGHVLLVDDEEQVRQVLGATLRDQGYQVVEAADGPAAVMHLDGGGACDALVSDLAMPGMDGLAVVRAARQRRPGLPALLITGYAGDAGAAALEEAAGAGALQLLHKPIDPEALAVRLAALLQDGGTTGTAR
ncbi:response regulator [Pseudoroseomonas globiformis]|uniref:histidine kinase n=1 Tax=Teichococcus globiformis TaxID=2307229 RepID=A0ABV7FW81_9PROT